MTGKAITPTPKAQGAAAPSLASTAGLYQTRTSLFGRHLPLWEGGSASAAGEGAGGIQLPAGAGAGASAPATDVNARLAAALEGLLNQPRHGGDAGAVALTLLQENHGYRDQIRTLQGQVPAAGSVVLTPEQAQAWQTYQQLDADPAALRTRLEQGSQAVEREQTRELATVSSANPTVLADRLRAAGLRAEVRDVAAEGTNPARREVRVLNAEGQDQGELREYATQHWADYVTALFPATSTPAQGTGTVLNGQAAGSAATGAPPSNPIAAALAQGRPAAEGSAAPVVDALSFS